MYINDVVLGLAAGVGLDISPDGKTVFYVEWSVGQLSKVDTATRAVTTVKTGLQLPEDVEIDWATGDIYISERTGAITQIVGGKRSRELVRPGGAPQQLDLKKNNGKRYLYTVGYDSGELIRIDIDTQVIDLIAKSFGHPVGLVVDQNEKFAYVTEQDSASLIQVEIGTGAKATLFAGLISPFFLAWDVTAKAIFCVQRDPINNLILLDLNTLVSTVVQNGLSWRPSGVAPNANNSLIYICGDGVLEVLSTKRPPPTKKRRPPFRIHSVQFQFDKSSALRIKDHKTGNNVALPEFVNGVRSEPAAYTRGSLPKVKVVFKQGPAYTAGSYSIGATGSLGGIRRKTVTPIFNSSGLSNPIEFEFMWPITAPAGKPDVTLNWYARHLPGASVPVSLGSESHRLYILLSKPTAPWSNETPWIAALEIACGWASGSYTHDDAAAGITHGYYHSGRVSYDTVQGATFYDFNSNSGFYLSQMIDRLNGGFGLGEKVNCTDSACTVSTFANLLGCDLWQSRMGSGFNLNPMQAIGYTAWVVPFSGAFSYHEVAWKGACGQNDRLFDGCLTVDGDGNPGVSPFVTLLPINMVFGDCATIDYRLRLCPPNSGGCAQCTPTAGSSRRRRTIQ